MENFEKNLRDKFNNASSREGIDPNDLWNSIATEITDSNESPGSPTPSNNQFKKYLPFLLLLLLALGGILIYQYSEESSPFNTVEISEIDTDAEKIIGNENLDLVDYNSSNTKPQHITSIEEQISSQTQNSNTINFQKNTLANKDNVNIDEKPNLNSNTSNSLLNESISTNIITAKNRHKYLSSDLRTNGTDSFVSRSSIENSTTPQNHTFLNTKNESDQPIEKFLVEENEIAANNANIANEDKILSKSEMLENFDLLTAKAIGYPLEVSSKSLPAFSPTSVKFDKSQARFSIGFHGGTQVLWEKFEGDQAREITRAEELNQAFKLFPGQYFGATVNFRFNQHVFIETGIAFNRSISQFNRIIETKDSIIIRNDIFQGQKVMADATRTIVHHNKLSTLRIPVSLGYQFNNDQWSFGTSAGIAINFTQKYSGRVINDNNIVINYPSGEGTDAPANPIYLSYHLNPYINYELNTSLSLQLQPSFGFHQFGKTELYGVKHTGWSTGIRLGLIYTP